MGAAPDSVALDDQTWIDLLLAPWLASLSGEVSIAGRQELYRRLRALHAAPARIDAVLDTLAARSIVLVSSHNLVLASLLEHRLAPHCLGRDADGRLALAPGVPDRTNGIALLGAHGFGAEIERKAQKVALWLAGYLGRPEAGAHVLGKQALADAPVQM